MPGHHEKGPKVPVTYLGVDTSQVPTVVSDQLGLAKGFGLVVDYVEPNSPAATAGVQQNDILKLLNDQILIEPSQLRKLLQTFPEGTEVTLTVLRKGQEQKLTAKLVRKEVSQRRGAFPGGNHDWNWDFDAAGDLDGQMRDLKEQLKEQLGNQRGIIREAVTQAHEAARHAHATMPIVQPTSFGSFFEDDGATKASKIDLGKAQIVFSDDKGELKLANVDGRKLLTAKDPQGKLLFSGPVETKEDLDKAGAVREGLERIRAGAPASEGPSPTGTTHISVVDEQGNAAALTVSTGSGSGVIVPGTGIHINNMLGEFDLGPEGGDPRPGVRLTSMMAPTVVIEDGRPRLVLGSAGSSRLRGAILQVVVNVVHHGLPVEEAISAPRIHMEDGQVQCEGGSDPAALDRLASLGYELVRWQERNLYFGGVSAVEMLPDGTLAAAGDPRRGGHGIVVTS